MHPKSDVLEVAVETRHGDTLFAWTATWVTVACPCCRLQHLCCLVDRSEAVAWCPRSGQRYTVTVDRL